MSFIEEIARRRTFGIISHPDAGKTTLTENLRQTLFTCDGTEHGSQGPP